MHEINNSTGFITAILLFQLAPGPGTVAILGATARGGIRSGMGAVFGTLAGDMVYMLVAVSGLAAVVTASPRLFILLQWGGIAYLCRFGWRLLRSAGSAGIRRDDAADGNWQPFRRAFCVGLTNPKVIMFFMAFFPLFMTARSGPVTLLIMMAHVSLLSLVYQTCLVLVGDRIAGWFSRLPGVHVHVKRFAGCMLIGFGLKLALDQR
jgi:threonine/homoserine/homoserine lactone efflux protein